MVNIETITPDELCNKLYELSHLCYENDKKFVLADEEYQMLEDAKKPYLAVLMDSFNVKTSAEKERLAYASLDYIKWQQGYQAARSKARLARVERDNTQRLFDTCRSILSSKNREFQRIGA